MEKQDRLMLGFWIVAVVCALIASGIWMVTSKFISNDVVYWVLLVPYVCLVFFLEWRWYIAVFSQENMENLFS